MVNLAKVYIWGKYVGAVAQNIHIKRCDSIIEQVCDAVSQWKSTAKEYEIPNEITNAIESNLLYDASCSG